nr:uncharacterized protein LOC123760643 [Procambarus clarkii]
MPLDLRLYHAGVSDIKKKFNQKIEEHKAAQLDNPFSEWEGAGSTARRLSKDDEGYGMPLPGSATERRRQAAEARIMTDIRYLCDMIWDCSEWRSPDGRAAITFGKLFKLYITISDKVVGILLRARKHHFVYFEGEMLYQRRDDDKVIELTRSINTIRARFGKKPVASGGGEVEPWGETQDDDDDDDEDDDNLPPGAISRRNSTPGGIPTSSISSLTTRRHSMPHTTRSLLASRERIISRTATEEKEDEVQEEYEQAASASDPETINNSADPLPADDELRDDIERKCNLLDAEEQHTRVCKSRSANPLVMDTIMENIARPVDGERGGSSELRLTTQMNTTREIEEDNSAGEEVAEEC